MLEVDGAEFSVHRDFWSDDYLFHYTSIQTALEHILYTSSLRLGPFVKTSDPFEYNGLSIGVGMGRTTPEEDEYKSKLGHSIASRLTAEFDSYRFIAFCCSEDEPGNFDKLGMLKQRMWSQYAEAHSGICLVFSREKILDALANQGHNPYSKKIKYRSFDSGFWAYPAIDVPDGMNQDEEELFISHRDRFRSEYFFSKHLDYKDESEFRVIVDSPDKEHIYFEFRDSLRAIIVSDRAGEYLRERALEYSESFAVPFLSLGWTFRSPSIFHFWKKKGNATDGNDRGGET